MWGCGQGVGWGIGGVGGVGGNGMMEKGEEMGGRICQWRFLGVWVDCGGDTRPRGGCVGTTQYQHDSDRSKQPQPMRPMTHTRSQGEKPQPFRPRDTRANIGTLGPADPALPANLLFQTAESKDVATLKA